MLLVVGLGNPGPEYAKNRHNIGFMAIDAIARRHGFGPFRGKFQGEIADGLVAGEKVMALKPMTYMNESGRSVGAAVDFFKIAPEDVVVFHDEIDLAAGKIRVKRGGGHAGHNGLRSIHNHIGPDYGRVRIGVGHPGDKDRVSGHVLNDFAKPDTVWVATLLDALAEHFDRIIDGDDADYMSRVTLAMAPPKPKKPRPGPKDGTAKDDNGL